MRGLTLWNTYRTYIELKVAADSLEKDVPGLETFYIVQGNRWALYFIIPTPQGNGHNPDVVPTGGA